MTVTTSHAHGRPRSRFLAIFVYTLRSCLPLKRWAAIVLPCAGAVLFGLLARAIDDTPGRAFANVAAEAVFGLMMPIAALIVGDSVLGAEVRSGTFHFTWLSPAPIIQIVAGRWLAGAVVIMFSIAPACGLSAVVAGVPENAWPAFLAAATGGIAYVALFIAIACVTRRTAVWSLAVVFLVERLLGTALTAIAQLSPTWQSRAVYTGLAEDVPQRLERAGIPSGSGAVVRLAIIAAVSLAVAHWRMSRMQLAGASD